MKKEYEMVFIIRIQLEGISQIAALRNALNHLPAEVIEVLVKEVREIKENEERNDENEV